MDVSRGSGASEGWSTASRVAFDRLGLRRQLHGAAAGRYAGHSVWYDGAAAPGPSGAESPAHGRRGPLQQTVLVQERGDTVRVSTSLPCMSHIRPPIAPPCSLDKASSACFHPIAIRRHGVCRHQTGEISVLAGPQSRCRRTDPAGVSRPPLVW